MELKGSIVKKGVVLDIDSSLLPKGFTHLECPEGPRYIRFHRLQQQSTMLEV